MKERGELARHLESLLGRLGLQRREKNIIDFRDSGRSRGLERPSPVGSQERPVVDQRARHARFSKVVRRLRRFPDGEHFLLLQADEGEQEAVFVLNWFEH